MKKPLLLLFTFCSLLAYSQIENKGKLLNSRKFYVIDSIPIYTFPPNESAFIADTLIHSRRKATDVETFKKYKVEGKTDEIIFVITKPYFTRPDSIKKIPSRNSMDLDLQDRYKLKGSKQLYEGRFLDYFINGLIKANGYLAKGRLDGVMYEYYENTQLKSDKNYKNGEPDDEWHEYYEDGKLKIKCFYVNGKYDGIYRSWYPNGQLKEETPYKKGRIHGQKEEWYSTGILKSSVTYQENFTFLTPLQKRVENKVYFAKNSSRTGSPISAVNQLGDIISYDSTNTDHYMMRGEILVELANYDQAIDDFSKALQIEPLLLDAHYYRVVAALKLYDPKPVVDTKKKKDTPVENLLANEIPDNILDMICKDLEFLKTNLTGEELADIEPLMKKYCR